MVANMPRLNSFFIISATGLPIFSERSLTVIVSVVITAFSILTGSGLCMGCCCFLAFGYLEPNCVSSSQPLALSFIDFRFLDFLSLSRALLLSDLSLPEGWLRFSPWPAFGASAFGALGVASGARCAGGGEACLLCLAGLTGIGKDSLVVLIIPSDMYG